MNKILLFTATFNEKKNLIINLKKLNQIKISYDLLIIDDNSNDGSKLILNFIKKNKNFRIIQRKEKLGLNTAYQVALQYAKKNKYDYMISFDADLQHDVSVIPIFIKYLKSHNFVIGSRYILGGKSNLKGLRHLVSLYGNRLIKIFFKLNLSEFTTSFRGYDKKVINLLLKKRIKSSGYSFFMESVLLIYFSGLRIKEIPIFFYKRQFGTSKLPKIEIIRTIFNILRIYILRFTNSF